jgi:DNA-binding transcriptional MerR regulator
VEQKRLKVKEAAEFLRCSSETIRRLNRRGILKAQRNFLGHRVFELDELLKVKAQREELFD